VFYYAVSDTPDSLIVHFPDLDLVLHNTAVTPMLFSQYTLRGDYYRDPVDMIQSIDTLRQLDAKYVVGAHGYPLTDREQARDVATAHRDAYAFVYNQSVRGINKGMNPEQLVQTVRLPKHLRDNPWLYPAYVDNEYNVRGQYRGILGWYAEDTADLHPPTTLELGSVMVEGFGGSAQVIGSAKQAFAEKKYNLSAKLLSYVLAVEPENKAARQLKADALRAMAQTTRSGVQTRNFLLTHARHLEGKQDWNKPPQMLLFGSPSVDSILRSPPGYSIELLESRIDPEASASIDQVVKVTFSDHDKSWALHVRRGVAEVSDFIPEQVDIAVEMPRSVWARLVLKETTIENEIAEGNAKVEGNQHALSTILNSFDKI
jgi:alkyl sulfatase BDS1-like metallo-beta-lactamase superfamily hydrolase